MIILIKINKLAKNSGHMPTYENLIFWIVKSI
jgi:hypothetical protein